jgi:hypothetical protein
VTDETGSNDAAAGAKETPSPRSYPVDRRRFQRNFAERLFPGPSNPMSNQLSDHIEGLLRPLDDEAAREARRGRQGRPPSAPTPDDLAQLRDTLEQQNELLRAILASSVDTQADARSTAQNSRTFAWAGTAIALLTLIATVISVVAAVHA